MLYKNNLKKCCTSTRHLCINKFIVVLIFAFAVLFPYCISFAAEIGRYEVVAGSGENAYLVDKASGQVWILTHRTLGTGREPVAIPYKFIKISPKNQNEFLVEQLEQDAPFKAK